jgi:hypothetical protein
MNVCTASYSLRKEQQHPKYEHGFIKANVRFRLLAACQIR